MINRFISRVMHTDLFFYFMVAINTVGTIYGIYWYKGQLSQTPWHLWLLTSDSPLAAAYFLGALFLIRRGYTTPGAEFWKTFAYFALIKYGLWTTYIIGAEFYLGEGMTAIDAMLMLSHLGMAMQAILYMCYFPYKPRLVGVLLAASFFILNDYCDYWLGLHPYFSRILSFEGVRTFAVGTTLVLILTFALIAVRSKSEPRLFARRAG